MGSSSNGGLAPNVEGYCEKYCSLPYSGVRYCGDGDNYSQGDSINCNGCAQSQGEFYHNISRETDEIWNIRKCKSYILTLGQKYVIGTCTNTRDNNFGAFKCSDQLKGGKNSCNDYLRWKDCDAECNLCACSTAHGTNEEHCSGHGTCVAECSMTYCQAARCDCDNGWTGEKCELPSKFPKNKKNELSISLNYHTFCKGVTYFTFSAPTNCIWSEWEYGQCSKSCGGGKRTNHRKELVHALNGGKTCLGSTWETEDCNTQSCPGGNLLSILFTSRKTKIYST